ncbi:hypothetical protein [Nocardioides sp. SYSU D00038]|uniref:hypothetical protein n=1 Tax=Nocardioides sp. SYSU D00038 TaxID=2812554 RepID=UPI001968921D|nr:hypothetical protein [Nocardioides sp. SYSU D00038]
MKILAHRHLAAFVLVVATLTMGVPPVATAAPASATSASTEASRQASWAHRFSTTFERHANNRRWGWVKRHTRKARDVREIKKARSYMRFANPHCETSGRTGFCDYGLVLNLKRTRGKVVITGTWYLD